MPADSVRCVGHFSGAISAAFRSVASILSRSWRHALEIWPSSGLGCDPRRKAIGKGSSDRLDSFPPVLGVTSRNIYVREVGSRLEQPNCERSFFDRLPLFS